MITYAHENFIEQAINGVLMQECDFEIELIISNDCSPDKTDEIISKILIDNSKSNLIRYIKHDQNIGSISNFIYSLKETKGRYVALCEGDDYWTDPFKLQKQLDFLENNQEYIICGHWQTTVNEKGDDIISIEDPSSKLINLATRCVLFRNGFFKQDFFDFFQNNKNLGETFVYHYLSQFGNSIILPFHGAAYRISPVGIYSMIGRENQIKLSIKGCTEMQAFFKNDEQYLILEKITLRKAHFYNDYSLLLLDEGKLIQAFKKNYLLNKELSKIKLFSVIKNKFISININFYIKLILFKISKRRANINF